MAPKTRKRAKRHVPVSGVWLRTTTDGLPQLEFDRPVSVLTDPVWPNVHPDLVGAEDPLGLFTSTLAVLPAAAVRLVVWLGVQSDPRFLVPVDPVRWPFLRASYLRRAVPGYNGRCLVTGDVAYSFGSWVASAEGRRVVPGEASVTSKPSLREPHPCARNEEHARWIVRWWSDPGDVVLDPTAGVGTTLVAARALGRRAVGIEIEERHCARTVERLAQGNLWSVG